MTMQRVTKWLAAVVIVLLAITLVTGYMYTRQSVVVPRIIPAQGQSSYLPANHSFSFQDKQVTISVPVDSSIYNGAKSTDKSVSIYGNVSESTWIAESYHEMVCDPAQDRMYDDLAGQFRSVRDAMQLSDDEYLELMAAYTQSLAYVTTPDNPAKYPVETLVDGTGDCDDKSLLLAGLLSHEGYRVALLSFTPESHMALGIGSTGPLYKNTSYAYLETTNLSYAGIVPEKLGGGVTLRTDPLVIPVGNGTMLYQSGAETTYLEDMATLSEQQAMALEPEIARMTSDLYAEKDRITKLESRMQALRSTGNIVGYNSLVPQQNALVSEYNANLASYRQLYARYDTYVNIHNYIASHPYDRKGVYAYVKTHMPR